MDRAVRRTHPPRRYQLPVFQLHTYTAALYSSTSPKHGTTTRGFIGWLGKFPYIVHQQLLYSSHKDARRERTQLVPTGSSRVYLGPASPRHFSNKKSWLATRLGIRACVPPTHDQARIPLRFPYGQQPSSTGTDQPSAVGRGGEESSGYPEHLTILPVSGGHECLVDADTYPERVVRAAASLVHYNSSTRTQPSCLRLPDGTHTLNRNASTNQSYHDGVRQVLPVSPTCRSQRRRVRCSP